MFINSIIEKCVGKAFDIDCFDIEVHGFEDNTTIIFKGPGSIHGDKFGRFSFKLYNQLPITKEIFKYFKRDNKDNNLVKLNAKSYDGIEWSCAWATPWTNFFELSKTQNSLIHGVFNQLVARIDKAEGDKRKNITELVFAGPLKLPYLGSMHEKQYHGEDVISWALWHDHHDLKYKDSNINFQESLDHSRTHITASHHDGFNFPFVEIWLIEALTFITARKAYPRMIIRHYEDHDFICVAETPDEIRCNMPPPFFGEHKITCCVWDLFPYYLSKCEEKQEVEYIQITKGFNELLLASSGTLQGFIISLSLYIEMCMNLIFENNKCNNKKQKHTINIFRRWLDALVGRIERMHGDVNVIERAKRLLTLLSTPDLTKNFDTLIASGVICDVHKEVWKSARNYVAHGHIIDFSKEEEFWHYRNHLISMVYRLTLCLLGYRGKVMDYDGDNLRFVDFNWNLNINKKTLKGG